MKIDMPWVAAIGAWLGTIVLWQLTVIAALRIFGIKVPFPVAFHIYPREQYELLDALNRRSKDTFVFISGVLLLAGPWFVGLIACDYIVGRSAGHLRNYGLDHIIGSAVVFVLMIWCGISTSASEWNKSSGNSSPRS